MIILHKTSLLEANVNLVFTYDVTHINEICVFNLGVLVYINSEKVDSNLIKLFYRIMFLFNLDG